MLTSNLQEYVPQFTGYTELRMQENRNLSIGFLKGNNTRNVKSTTSGISARVYQHGAWGFASSPDFTSESFRLVIASAGHNAQFLAKKANLGKPQLPVNSGAGSNSFATTKPRLKQRQLIDFIKQLDSYIGDKYPDLSSRSVSLNCLDMEKSLLTSDGSEAYSLIPRTIIAVSLTMDSEGKPLDLYDVFGGLGQFEDVFDNPEVLYGRIDSLYEHIRAKQSGVYASAGVKECILDPELAGILAHEAIGHTTEADLVLGGSIAANYLNKEVASPLVTLIDFANTAMGQTCPVPVYIDDEGTEADDAYIIDQGVLKGYMHNKESANHFKVAPTGNGRAYQFSDEPLIRMRNTAIMPGQSKLAAMISSVEDGYYLIRPNNGQADTTSEFMFGVVLGYEIKSGKLGRGIKDTTISGVAFDMLKTITMISDDMQWSAAGMCGKKQPIPTGMGGPAIKCRVNIGGR